MADDKPSKNSYNLLGGINLKTSRYNTGLAAFLDLQNVDFYRVNALTKRPGSTQAITTGLGAAVNSLFEFEQTSGASFFMMATNANLYLRNSGGGISLLGSIAGASTTPTSFVTYFDRAFFCNGAAWRSFNGTSVSDVQTSSQVVGPTVLNLTQQTFTNIIFVANRPHQGGSLFQEPGPKSYLYAAYRYLDTSGNLGPLNIFDARIVSPFGISNNSWIGISNATDINYAGTSGAIALTVSGFTIPSAGSYSAIDLFLAFDGFTQTEAAPGFLASSIAQPSPTSNFEFGGIRQTVERSVFRPWLRFPANTTQVQLQNINFSAFISASAAGINASFFTQNNTSPRFQAVISDLIVTAGANDTPNSLIWSNTPIQDDGVLPINVPVTFPSQNVLVVGSNDGDRITGLRAFNNELIVFKQRSFYRVLVSQSADVDFEEEIEVSLEYGCISDKTIVEFKERLIFLDQQGLVTFDGTSYQVISQAVEPIFRRMNLTAALNNATAAHYPFRNQIWFGIPIDGATQNNITIVYDYLLDIFTTFTGFSPTALTFAKQQLNQGTIWRGDQLGFVSYHSESFFSDNNQAFTCLLRSSFDKDGENNTFMYRRLFFDVTPVAVGATGSVAVFRDYNTTLVQATFTVNPQLGFQSRAEIGVPAKSAGFLFTYASLSSPMEFNGYTWTKRYLRNV